MKGSSTRRFLILPIAYIITPITRPASISPVPSEAFRGDLSEIPPFAVLQIMEMGRKTGVLKIEADTNPGSLWLRHGNPIHAETKGQVGFDAALRLVCAKRGRFAFEPTEETPEATITATVTELLLEAARQLDEGRL